MTRRVTIAGGDVNAWMAAAYLARRLEDELKRRLARVRTQIQDAVNALPAFAG